MVYSWCFDVTMSVFTELFVVIEWPILQVFELLSVSADLTPSNVCLGWFYYSFVIRCHFLIPFILLRLYDFRLHFQITSFAVQVDCYFFLPKELILSIKSVWFLSSDSILFFKFLIIMLKRLISGFVLELSASNWSYSRLSKFFNQQISSCRRS